MLSPLESTNQTGSAAKFRAIPRVPSLSQSSEQGFCFSGCVWADGAGVGDGIALIAEQAVSNPP